MNPARFVSGSPAAAGAGLILLTVTMASFIPVVLSSGGSQAAPFLSLAVFNGVRCCVSCGLSLLLAGGFRRLGTVFRAAAPAVLWYFPGRMENLIFILSLRYISPALSILVSETYPVFCMLLLSRDARARRSGWASLSAVGVAGVLLAMGAVALGAAAQWGDGGPGGSLWGFALGCALAASISAALSFDSRVLIWSLEAGRRLSGLGAVRAGVVGLALWYGLSSLFAAAVFLPAGLALGESVSREGLALNALAGGVSGVGAVSWRSGYLLSRRPEFVGLMSFFPVLSGLWLAAFGLLETDPRLMFPALLLVCLSGLLMCRGRELPGLLRRYRRSLIPWNSAG